MFTWNSFNLDHLEPCDTITWQNLFHVTWSRGFQSVKNHLKTFRSSRQHYCKTNSKRHIHTGRNLEILIWNLKNQIFISRWIFYNTAYDHFIIAWAISLAFYPIIQYLFVQEVQVKSIFSTEASWTTTKSSTTNGSRLVISACVFVYTEKYSFNSRKHDVEIAKLLKRS